MRAPARRGARGDARGDASAAARARRDAGGARGAAHGARAEQARAGRRRARGADRLLLRGNPTPLLRQRAAASALVAFLLAATADDAGDGGPSEEERGAARVHARACADGARDDVRALRQQARAQPPAAAALARDMHDDASRADVLVALALGRLDMQRPAVEGAPWANALITALSVTVDAAIHSLRALSRMSADDEALIAVLCAQQRELAAVRHGGRRVRRAVRPRRGGGEP